MLVTSCSGTSAQPLVRRHSLLIAVGVALETMKQIDSQLMMRNYEGFLSRSTRGPAAAIRRITLRLLTADGTAFAGWGERLLNAPMAWGSG